MLPAGPRDRKIRFEQGTPGAPSESGEAVMAWALVAEVWGSKEPLVGNELFRAQQLVAKVDTRFRTLWSGTLSAVTPTETYRIVCDGRTYDVTHAAEVRRREGLEFLAAARAE